MSRQARDHLLTSVMEYKLIIQIFKKQGRDFTHCEQCGREMKKFNLHHTKYDGATINDLQIVCSKCDKATRNRGLK